jgi:hypothetical protein
VGTPDRVGEDAGLLVEAMRHLADQQVERAERVRAAARQTFAYVTGIFTLAQAGALTAFGQKQISGTEQKYILALALLAAVGVGVTAIFALSAERLRRAPEIAPDDITKAGDQAAEHGEPVGEELTLLYARRIDEQVKVINERRAPLTRVTIAAGVTIAIVVAELIVALIARFA